MALAEEDVMNSGMIVEYHSESCTVSLDSNGSEVIAVPSSKFTAKAQKVKQRRKEGGLQVFAQQLTIGDHVELLQKEDGHYFIENCLPRQTWLARKGVERYLHEHQLVVANADQLAVVVAPNPRIKPALIDRYFLAGIQGGLRLLLVVNKLDLDPALEQSGEVRLYQELGYEVCFTSATEGTGLEELKSKLGEGFTVFCGQSGVGKSSLLTRLTGIELTIRHTKRRKQTGRYTTETSRAYPLPGGGYVVDTPGIRVFGLSYLTWLDVHEYFADIAELAEGCKYADCLHESEPSCAVRAAVENGVLPGFRLDSYIRLRKECSGRL
jgi:ribosome biogenesis GTPase